MDKQINVNRWRLILGKNSENNLSFNDDSYHDLEDTLDYLYERGKNENSDRRGSLGGSNLNAVTWINKVRELFPKQAVEKIEKHAIEEFNVTELLCDKKTLEKMEPSHDLLKNILSFKNLMNDEVLSIANRLVKKVVDEISENLEQEVSKSVLGKVNRNEKSNVKMYRNFDIKRTIKQNLKNYDNKRKKIILDKLSFNSNIRRNNSYRVVILVDESGSMLDSVIHSAVMAGIFAKLPVIDVKLVIFDTSVVDLSGYVDDPVETLMKVQLGGGTDIGKALLYSSSLVEIPSKTIMVLVSDLFEGNDPRVLYTAIKDQIDSGVKFVALTSLDYNAQPNYNREAAKNIANMGGFVGAMTPDKLSDYIGRIIR